MGSGNGNHKIEGVLRHVAHHVPFVYLFSCFHDLFFGFCFFFEHSKRLFPYIVMCRSALSVFTFNIPAQTKNKSQRVSGRAGVQACTSAGDNLAAGTIGFNRCPIKTS